ncbi:hypothetical protein BSKO_09539 [Bryopsis sp. KO-2023]|nr:hypothetical protein BSKO_09539 [Bryopsis sp. KO-2023]
MHSALRKMTVEDVSIHPLFLSYSSPDLERRYTRHRKTSLLNADWYFLQVNLVLHFLFVLAESFQFVESSNYVTATLAAVSGFSIVLLQWGLMSVSEGSFWCRCRTWLLILLRSARLTTFSFGAPLWFGKAGTDVGTLLKNLVLRSGSLKTTWLAFGMPLMFKHHLPLQVVSVVALGVATYTQLVEGTCRSGAALLMKVWESVNEMLLLLAGAPFNNHNPDVKVAAPVACGHVLMLIHFVLGFLIPSFALWRFELSSRRSFVTNLPSDDETKTVRIGSTDLPNSLQVFAFVVVGVAALWTLVTDFAG